VPVELARAKDQTPAQIVLHVHLGKVATPKARDLDRVRQNIDVFDSELDPDETERIGALEGGDSGPTPRRMLRRLTFCSERIREVTMSERTVLPVMIVTGATSGIGRAAAGMLAGHGWYVVASGLEDELGEAVTAELRAAGSGEFIPSNLTLAGAPERLIATVVERHGRLDGLVNDAGIYRLGDTVETSIEEWDAVVGLNLRAAFLMCRAAIPHMVATGGGVIVNVASEAGISAFPHQVAYNVSKAGMLMLTRSIAVDHAAQKVRAVSVCPGTTMTPMVAEAIRSAPNPQELERRFASVRPANRLGTMEEIATAIVFAASPSVQYMTGNEIVIDGGFTAS